ncbi:LlaJI family restriction endonuclease [Candidatus Saccharibacteria bacterium]|nr:LlaJI family restriction endonuclease [Candidatus Saccharibacteria bacterium]
MIFLFEEFAYSTDYLKEVIGYRGNSDFQSESGFNTKAADTGAKINGVGYCFFNGNPVFVLPKVFLDCNNTRAFGVPIAANGEDIFGKGDSPIKNIQRRFLSSLSTWLYSAIDKYRSDSDMTGVRSPDHMEHSKFQGDARYATLLDVMSSMELFYKKNQNLFVFVAKNKHSGNNKINWQRTIAKKIPFIQGDSPIYMELVNKKKVFDLDDRLLVLYFSAMKFIQDEFGFEMPQSEYYVPLKKQEFARLMENERGLRELRRIKYKYFEDRLLKLYNIMEAFFRWGAKYTNKDVKAKEYLIANSFNNVFEAMIDSLISDQGDEITKLKNNEDGKIIDHLYKEKSLIFADGTESIWHIGDSKYYQEKNEVLGQSIAKQYTYAKNIVQNFFSPDFVDENKECYSSGVHEGVRYRDSVTEGYSVTPNFFIRGFVPEYDNDEQYTDPYFSKKDDSKDSIEPSKEDMWEKRNRHFRNRLFDRDTLLLKVYNINFLYVLKTYTSKHSSLREEFKKKTRDRFRKEFLELLDREYFFWALFSKPQNVETISKFVDDNFKKLVGRVFRPSNSASYLILALEKGSVKDEGSKEYWDIRNAVTQANIDVFNVKAQELWADGALVEYLRNKPGWGEEILR